VTTVSEVRLEGLSLLRTALEIRSPIFEAREVRPMRTRPMLNTP